MINAKEPARVVDDQKGSAGLTEGKAWGQKSEYVRDMCSERKRVIIKPSKSDGPQPIRWLVIFNVSFEVENYLPCRGCNQTSPKRPRTRFGQSPYRSSAVGSSHLPHCRYSGPIQAA